MGGSLFFITCILGVSLNICVNGIQIGKSGNDVLGISMLDISKEDSEFISSLRDGTIFQENGKTCSSDSDCLYEGKCSQNGSCSCPDGTNGTLCENVIECMEHPHMCGNGTDVKCVFSVKSKHAFCQCTEILKWFNHFSERCAEPCEYRKLNKELVKKDCGLYGRCTNQFCWCVDGVSGDFCNKIDQCDKMDCGSDKTTTCTLGIDGAYCKCNKNYQVFDKTEKICKGEPCRTNNDCMYGGKCTTDGTCSCPKGTDGPQCQDVIGCITDPNMCGKGTDVKCIFNEHEGHADCRCEGKNKAFNSGRKRCAEPCQYYIKDELIEKDCGKYGRCSTNGFCWCVPGTSGDRCETIDQCASKEVDCTNEPKSYCTLGINGAYCKCNVTYQVFDNKEKICKGEPCKKDPSNCQYGGNCTDDGTCNCIKGVGGPLCEQVYECEAKPDMCGNGTDVTCAFAPTLKRAFCMCEDEEKSYDLIEKKCKKDCENDKDCGQFGRCDKKGFCRCLEGVSGDSCETIEKCVNVDCGPTNCTLGGDGEARCVCPDANQGFDYDSKTCKACECGDNSKGCEFREGQKKCECALNYYRKGDKCEACNCGELSMGCELRDGKKECFCPLNYTTIGEKCQKCSCGIGSYHCRMKNGKTDCVCYEPYKQKIDKCEFCDCGVHGGKCSFTNSGKKQCICEPGFKMLEETGFCTQVCNTTNKCQNGGMCVEDVCRCRENYAGAWCETPKWCLHNRCGHHFNQDDVDCIWDNTKKEGRCQCKDPLSFYRDDRTCDRCDCGSHGHCILTERGEKVCICNEGYADYSLNCKRCDCGSDSTNCTFDYLGNRLCQCKELYKQKDSGEFTTCARCDCGDDGICEFGGVSKTQKVCHCKENYKVFNGGCQECDCGRYGSCSFDSYGHKVCTCDFGYSDRKGRCESCDCEPPKIRGIGSSCIFKNSVKECHCPEGYESTKNEFCEDINECLNATACSKNTDCLNLPGSYSCQCKTGFRPPKLGLDPKHFDCEDIDECAEEPCTSNTFCVNTPGSYDCKCKEGYYPTSSTSGPYYNPHYATCNKEETQWRGASIALGVILSLGILGLGGYIFYLKKGFRR